MTLRCSWNLLELVLRLRRLSLRLLLWKTLLGMFVGKLPRGKLGERSYRCQWRFFSEDSRRKIDLLITSLLRRRAHHQFRFQDDALGLRRHFGPQNGKRNPRRLFADQTTALVDTGERHPQCVVIVEISTSNERDIFGDSQSFVKSTTHRADGERVVEAEDGVGPRFEPQ